MAKNYTLSELRAMRKQREAAIGWTDFAEVTLGATVNGGQYIGAGGTKVWVTVGGRTATQVERGDANIPDVFGRPALIGKPPGRSYYQLFSVQGGGDERSGTVSHAEQHTVKQRWRQLPQLGDMVDPAFIGQHQITDLLIVPSSGYTFRVLPGVAVVNSTPVQLSASVEFTVDDAEIPSTIGEAVICRVELDSTGAVQLSYGSAYTEPVDDLTAIANAPAADPSRRTLGYIWMPEGMTAGNWWHAFPASLAERTGVLGGGVVSVVAGTGVTVDNTDPANPVVSAPAAGTGIPSTGWVDLGETLTYGSADDPTYTATCVGVDLTGVLSAGMRLRVSQSTGGTKYFIITKVAFSTDTTITLYGGTDYDLANETVSNPYFSSVKAPHGFPLDPAKWTVKVTDTTQRSQATPTQNVWYNLGSVSIDVPIGCWCVDYQVVLQFSDGSSGGWQAQATLSTANNTESDTEFTTAGYAILLAALWTVFRQKTLTLTSKTTYYLNSRTTNTGLDGLYNNNAAAPLIIRAVCAYL